jgi:hypothetical protein
LNKIKLINIIEATDRERERESMCASRFLFLSNHIVICFLIFFGCIEKMMMKKKKRKKTFKIWNLDFLYIYIAKNKMCNNIFIALFYSIP